MHEILMLIRSAVQEREYKFFKNWRDVLIFGLPHLLLSFAFVGYLGMALFCSLFEKGGFLTGVLYLCNSAIFFLFTAAYEVFLIKCIWVEDHLGLEDEEEDDETFSESDRISK